MADITTIHRAKWVFPVSAPPIADGAVAVRGGRIEAAGPYQDLARRFPGRLVDHGEGGIVPALVNAHTHLELSAMAGKLSEESGFVDWVRDLIALRLSITPEARERAIREALSAMHRQGVGLVGDVGNTRTAYDLCRAESGTDVVFFQEFLGFNRERTVEAERVLEEMNEERAADESFHLAAHAPYSVSGPLFSALKSWANKRGKMLSVHLSECVEEQGLLVQGDGPLKDLLVERSVWDGDFTPPGKGGVRYLDDMGVLDRNTICVHLVHVTAEDLSLLAERGVRCCICPRSNLFLRVGLPDWGKMLAHGLAPALGTDSLASNYSLSVLDEMAALRKHFPGVHPSRILEAATLNGARVLGRDRHLGSLALGKDAKMLFVPSDGKDPDEALERWIGDAGARLVTWVM